MDKPNSTDGSLHQGDEDSQTGELPHEFPAPITIDTADPVTDKVVEHPSDRKLHPDATIGRSGLADCPARRRGGGAAGAGYGRRHRPRNTAPHLRPVHGGGTVPGPLARRVGHRTGFGAAPRGNAWGNGGGFQCFGARQRVRRASAGGVGSPAAGVIASQRDDPLSQLILARSSG